MTFDSTAFDFDDSPISFFLPGITQQTAASTNSGTPQVGSPVSQTAASLLSGGGLYLLHDPDGTVLIGLIQDPATATPSATFRVEFVNLDPDEYIFQPSVIEARYAPNPFVQTSVLAGADAGRKSFAERLYRSLDQPVGDNRQLYNDDAAPSGRRLVSDTRFTLRTPAQTEAVRVANHWDSPRPMRTFYVIGNDSSATDQGYTGYKPGSVVKIQSDRLTGGEATVLILDTVKSAKADKFVGR